MSQLRLYFLETFNVHYEDGCAADLNFYRIGCVHTNTIRSRRWNHLFTFLGVICDDGDNFIYLFILSTDQECGVARKEESTGSCKFCYRKVIF